MDPIIVYAIILGVVGGLITWFVNKHSAPGNRKHHK